MILLLSITVAVLFSSGAYLLLQRDMVRVVVGTILISNAATLYIISSGLLGGTLAPIYPLPPTFDLSDPLVQALALTAIVITFGLSALLLSIVRRVYTAYSSIDLRRLAEAEVQEETALAGEAVEPRDGAEG